MENWKEIEKDWLKNPKYVREYKKLAPRYAVISRLIAARLAKKPATSAGILLPSRGHRPPTSAPTVTPAMAAHLLFIFVCKDTSIKALNVAPNPDQA